MMKAWEEMSEHEQLSSIHYELYKDVHGFRPRHIDYDTMSVEELRADLDDLGVQLEANEKRAAERQAAAIKQFEELVEFTINQGARTRENAIRWLFEAENDPYVFTNPDHYCYSYGLPYGYFNKKAA